MSLQERRQNKQGGVGSCEDAPGVTGELRPSPLQGATVIGRASPYSSQQGQGERKEDFGGIQLCDLCAFKPLSPLHRALDQS